MFLKRFFKEKESPLSLFHVVHSIERYSITDILAHDADEAWDIWCNICADFAHLYSDPTDVDIFIEW